MDNPRGVAEEYRLESDGGNFLKGSDFDGVGLVVEVVGMEKFMPSDDKFGVKNQYGAGGVVTKVNWFIKQGILEEGYSFKYIFLVNGIEKRFDNSSLSFYFAFTHLNPTKGEKISIQRNKKSQFETEWKIITQD